MLHHSRYETLFRAAPLPSLILYTDSSFTIADVNRAFLDATGSNKEEIMDKTLFDVIPEAIIGDIHNFTQVLQKVLSTKDAVTLKDHDILTGETGTNSFDEPFQILYFTPLLNEDGAVDLISFSILEIEQSELQADTVSGEVDGASSLKITNSSSAKQPKDEVLHMLQERIKEQSCVYKISNLDEQELSVDQLLTEAVDILPDGWQYNEVAAACIEYGGQTYQTPDYQESPWTMSAEITVRKESLLKVNVVYLEERPTHDDGPFLDEERKLLNSVINHLSLKIDQIISQKEWAEKQRLLDKAYQLARIGTWEFDMSTHELTWSRVTKEVHGFGQDYQPDVESTINLFKEGVNREEFANAAMNAIEHAEPFDVELKIISGKGDERWIRATGEPEFKDGVCTRFYGISQNVSDRRQAEEDLQLSERRFRSLVQDGSDLIAILDEEFNYTYVSPTSESILGIPAQEFIGKNAFDYIHNRDRDRLFSLLSELSLNQRINIPPYRFQDADGNWRWVETTLTNMTEDPAVGGLVANSRDVTQQIEQQRKNLESLKEKETLLAEIHHRVKNNLAVVSGMMQLQATDENDEDIRDRLNDSIIRIKTMANIHEQLYQSNSFSKLAFADNIRSLVLNIKQTFQSRTQVDIDFNCDQIELNINQAIPCSLIINEVMTNIFKHAFPERENGQVNISLSECEENKCVHISISDNGIGLPENFSISESSSLGLNLIDVLSQQLEAKHNYESTSKETVFTIEFEKDQLKGIGNSLF